MSFLTFYIMISLVVGLFLYILSQENNHYAVVSVTDILVGILLTVITAVIWPIIAISFLFGHRWSYD